MNLLDIDSLVKDFLEKHEQGIRTLHRVHFHNDNELSIRSLTEELKDELRTGCVTFINKEYPLEELNPYLFYIVNDFAKKRATPIVSKKTEYLCPGCLFLGKETPIFLTSKVFKCEVCEQDLRNTIDPKKVAFFRTFFHHNKNGYHCLDCDRFLPHPVDESPTVTCPYFDCCFVGPWHSLRRMHHPTTKTNVEMLTLDISKDGKSSIKDAIPNNELDPFLQMEIEEEFDYKVKMLREIIAYQSNNVPYSSSDFTTKHKYLVYQAFSNLLKIDPVQMVNYLLHSSRSGGFQHKIFQEYVSLLEGALPFSFKKGNKLYKVESLLDDNLKIFEGISVFTGMVSEKLEVKNGTTEFYIGGRKASYTKPFYIGKLLSIVDTKSSKSLLDSVVEYSFSKIKLQDVKPGTDVIVTHLRIPPHYQMGGMVYVNRIRKKIVDRANVILNKNNEEV